VLSALCVCVVCVCRLCVHGVERRSRHDGARDVCTPRVPSNASRIQNSAALGTRRHSLSIGFTNDETREIVEIRPR
jgi:hypothetical protein